MACLEAIRLLHSVLNPPLLDDRLTLTGLPLIKNHCKLAAELVKTGRGVNMFYRYQVISSFIEIQNPVSSLILSFSRTVHWILPTIKTVHKDFSHFYLCPHSCS